MGLPGQHAAMEDPDNATTLENLRQYISENELTIAKLLLDIPDEPYEL